MFLNVMFNMCISNEISVFVIYVIYVYFNICILNEIGVF